MIELTRDHSPPDRRAFPGADNPTRTAFDQGAKLRGCDLASTTAPFRLGGHGQTEADGTTGPARRRGPAKAPRTGNRLGIMEGRPCLGWRLLASLALSTIGGIGLWSVVVALPVIEAEFGVDRGGASLPYTATMVGFALGGVLMGRLADRFGIMVPVMLGACMLGIGYVAAAEATSLWQFIVAQALLIGLLGSSATFGPLVADVSLWFRKRRGIAVAVVASGNYLAGTIWPPLLQEAIAAVGWRRAHIAIGVLCVVTMLPLALALRRRPPLEDCGPPATRASLPASRACRPRPCRRSWWLPGSAAASPCRCPRCTSSPTAPTSATAPRAAPRCSR